MIEFAPSRNWRHSECWPNHNVTCRLCVERIIVMEPGQTIHFN